jgi:hypothetical protein
MQTPIQIIVARIFLYVHIQGQLKEFSWNLILEIIAKKYLAMSISFSLGQF